MRQILGPVIVAGLLLLLSATASQAQSVPVGPIVMNNGFMGSSALPPSIYAAQQLPESLSHPWVMVPRYATAATLESNLDYGFRTSPYGVYSRFAYWSTGPYPAMPRPYARFEQAPCDRDHFPVLPR